MTKKKNVLLILSDQQRLDSLSVYHNAFGGAAGNVVRTPHIDALAREGMRFSNAYCSSAICAPSRASLMTGLFAHRHGVIDNFTDIRPGTPLLSEEMKKAGYYCGYAGKWHVSPTRTPEDCGFHGKAFMGYAFPGSGVFPSLKFNQPPDNQPNYYDEYLKEKGFEGIDVSHGFMGANPALQIQEMYARHDGPVESTIEYFVAEEAIHEIDLANESGKPFFIWANFWGPHSPSIVPEPYFSMYDPNDIPEHPSYRETFADKPYGYYLTEKMWGNGPYGWKGFADISAKYFGHCTFIDDMVGRITDRLKQLGIYNDTVIIYAADHGDCLGAHKLIEKGCFAFQEIYRIPLIVKPAHETPPAPAERVNDSMVYLQELMPTILDIAGTAPPKPVDGNSLLPLISDDASDNGRREIFGEFHDHFYHTRQRLVTTKDYWFTFNESERGELYDLNADHYQLVNRCYDPAYQVIKTDLMDRLSDWMKKTGDPDSTWYHRIKEYY
ncbi:MAG: sulfatase-like hydrolase/transferase [Firmicutes bacterium]|nr:sulfatase-like hydrolase/transferase [Bacillota bacterium]